MTCSAIGTTGRSSSERFPKRGDQFVAAVVDEKPAFAVKRVRTLFAVPEVGRTADRE